MKMKHVEYIDCGLMGYGACWEFQRGLFDALLAAKSRRAEGEEPRTAGHVLLCEHPHVYTLGKSGKQSNLLVGEEFLRSVGAEFHRIDRGGDITYHGPGQIVGYPILDLEQLGMGLREYIHAVEQTVIDTVADWGIRAGRVEGAAGVWLNDSIRRSGEDIDAACGGRLRKICAIGVRSSRYVTMHGFALNVNADLKYFSYINPCGFADRGATSIAAETGRKVEMERVREALLSHLERNMNIKIYKKTNYANREKLGCQEAG